MIKARVSDRFFVLAVGWLLASFQTCRPCRLWLFRSGKPYQPDPRFEVALLGVQGSISEPQTNAFAALARPEDVGGLQSPTIAVESFDLCLAFS